MKRLIIGYGNPLRGDDAFGYRAAEFLREENADPEVEILPVHQLTPELADRIARASSVVFIDAAVGETPGELLKRDVQPDATGDPFTHQATASALLFAAQALYGRVPPATLITVTAANLDFGRPLSPPVQEALDNLLSTFMKV